MKLQKRDNQYYMITCESFDQINIITAKHICNEGSLLIQNLLENLRRVDKYLDGK